MQSNTLHSYFADKDSIDIHCSAGFTVAHITPGKVSFRGTDTLRPVELLHLAEIAEQFDGFHRLALHFSSEGQHLMPIREAV